jgi:lipoate synthase
MSNDNSMYDGVEFVAHDLETMRKQYERLRYERAELNRKLEALRNEVKAARILGASSPLGFEFARKQWEDAKEVTDTLNALEDER